MTFKSAWHIRDTVVRMKGDEFNPIIQWYSEEGVLLTERVLYRSKLGELNEARIKNVVTEVRMEILSTLPYKRPSVKTLNSWLESSATLKQYVIAQHPINAYIVLNMLFEPPIGSFVEMLLVKLGEI